MSFKAKVVFSSVVILLILGNVVQFIRYQRDVERYDHLLFFLANTSREMGQLISHLSLRNGEEAGAMRQIKQRLDAQLSVPIPAVNASSERSLPTANPMANASPEPQQPTPSPVMVISEAREVNERQSVSSLIGGVAGEHVLVVEKSKSLLHLFRFEKDGTTLMKTYPCVIGENKNDKQKEGDMATPIGVYLLIAFIPDKDLAELYGAGAFVLNYPSLFDHKRGKQGHGIWLHGHPRSQTLGADKTSTKGCVVVRNGDLVELSGKIKIAETAIIVTDAMLPVAAGRNEQIRREIASFVRGWQSAWESRDVGKFIGFYSPDYVNNQGMRFRELRAQKKKVMQGKRYIKVGIGNVFILTTGRSGDIFVVKFRQDYRSDNYVSQSNKLLYVKKMANGLKIIGESAY